MRPFRSFVALAALIAAAGLTVPAAHAGAAAGRSHLVGEPTQADPTCATDTSAAVRAFVKAMPDNSTWNLDGGCYVLTGVQLLFPKGITIENGTFENPTDKTPPPTNHGKNMGPPVFKVIGGSHVTFRNLTLEGANPGGFHPGLAGASGIELDGTLDATIDNVSVSHVFGDGLNIDPLRAGADHMGGSIVAPTRNLVVNNFSADTFGRMGITPASLDGAVFTNITLTHPGFGEAFDFETDENGEGATNVTVNGCNVEGFFSFSSDGPYTGPITIENCTQKNHSGYMVNVRNVNGKPDKGEILFANDNLQCGSSAYVSCFQLNGATNFTTENSTVQVGYPGGTVFETAVAADGGTQANFLDDTVTGYGKLLAAQHPGTAVTVTGGTWTPGS